MHAMTAGQRSVHTHAELTQRGLRLSCIHISLLVFVQVQDAPGAAELTLRGGALEFRDVWFGYKPERLVLKDLSLKVPPT